jgi:beta-lactamase class A
MAGIAAICATATLAFGLPNMPIAKAAPKATGSDLTARAQAFNPFSTPLVPASVQVAQNELDTRLKELGRAFNGDVGIAVKDLQTGFITHYDGASRFPQQSVSKFWVALTALDKVDKGALSLSDPVTVKREDLTLFHQPIRALVKDNGYRTTVSDLLHRALTQSDNTANDFVLRKAGGPEAVRAYLSRMNIDGVRFGPGERLLQSTTAGLNWRPEYSIGNAFYTARANLPMETRRKALTAYLSDPMDGATPLAIVDALGRLKNGELLSRASTQLLLSTMSNTRTGARRLKGGLAPGWSLAHKTGTGQDLAGTSTGYNDIGIVTSPDGASYSVAVMIRKTSAPIPARMQLMQNVVRTVIDYDRALGSNRSFTTMTNNSISGSARK